MKIELSEQDVRLILACLAKQPYELVNAVIVKIQSQAAQAEKKEGEA